MSPALAHAGLIAIPQDTLVVVAARDAFDWIHGATSLALLLVLILILALLLGVMAQLRGMARSVERAGQAARSDPAFANLRSAAANLEAISARARSEGDRLADAVGSFSDRLDQASAHVETRIDEFNALLEVVQEEAEASFVDVAARARGVRGGVDHLGARLRSDRRAQAGEPVNDSVDGAGRHADPATGPDED
jgi:hypothetical protein